VLVLRMRMRRVGRRLRVVRRSRLRLRWWLVRLRRVHRRNGGRGVLFLRVGIRRQRAPTALAVVAEVRRLVAMRGHWRGRMGGRLRDRSVAMGRQRLAGGM